VTRSPTVRLEEEGEAALIGTVIVPDDGHNRVDSVTRPPVLEVSER
jgi:hypothetical protein